MISLSSEKESKLILYLKKDGYEIHLGSNISGSSSFANGWVMKNSFSSFEYQLTIQKKLLLNFDWIHKSTKSKEVRKKNYSTPYIK